MFDFYSKNPALFIRFFTCRNDNNNVRVVQARNSKVINIY